MGDAERILIVDDEPNVRLVFRTTLEAAGYAVTEAADGQAALDALTTGGPFGLVLLDLRMPGVDGMETLRRMRAQSLGHPVIIITAHGSVPDAVEAMKLGAIDFVQKPVTPEALRRAAGEVLARHAPSLPEEDLIAQAKRAINRREFDKLGPLLDRAFDLEVSTADAHYLRGLLLEMRGEHEKAYRALRAALDEDPTHEAAQGYLATHFGDRRPDEDRQTEPWAVIWPPDSSPRPRGDE